MANILTIFLLISTVLTGIIWIFYRIKHIKMYFLNKKNIKNNHLFLENKLLLKHETSLFTSLASFFPVFLTIFIIRSFIYEPFQIPSGSMMPTLLIGDFIIVEKFTYGIKEPITHKTLINTSNPKRGDVVVFRHPNDYNTNYIKRIIGLPGDKIIYDIKKKHIHICINYTNTKHCTEKLVIYYSKPKLSNFVQKIYFSNTNNNAIEQKKIYHLLHFNIVEENFNTVKHNILLLNNIKNSTQDYFQQKNMPKLTWIVPKNQYFMMGDNRDNSLDSRYWGFVPEENLVGKAIKIWMSFDKNENEWPTGIRINRIGNIY
ncbi:signal peptidase I [Buchnera aphidicola]|uniref:Signal peptidase I n=1 Tax=Buchnera aphidicola str. Ua (Uroleucon ambrosiae) TaxID=1005057 RepID=G2LPC2_BUCUM|nr:signal peptidase I [Buchnera aphidicola]AEO08059.1 signal peptidase I [Buchnera aphidicola str. Ua (Uroleucon ambrosiae)]